MLVILMTFVFGFAALVIALYCGVSLAMGVGMLLGVLWRIACLPFAIVGAFVRFVFRRPSRTPTCARSRVEAPKPPRAPRPEPAQRIFNKRGPN
jgi:hypothetical protein